MFLELKRETDRKLRTKSSTVCGKLGDISTVPEIDKEDLQPIDGDTSHLGEGSFGKCSLMLYRSSLLQ